MGPTTVCKGRPRPSFVDYLRRFYGRLGHGGFLHVACACVLYLTFFFPLVASASQCAAYDASYAQCQTNLQNQFLINPRMAGSSCKIRTVQGSPPHYQWQVWEVFDGADYGWTGNPLAFTCPAGLCPTTTRRTFQITMAQYGPITGGGPHLSDGICDMVFTSGGALNGIFRGSAQYTGSYSFQVGTGTPPADAPPEDQPCNVSDLLCFSPSDGSVCGNVGNQKLCTKPGATSPPPNTGNCTAGAGAAAGAYICGGSPTAPRPIDSQGNLLPDIAKISQATGTVVPGGGAPNYDINITLHNTNPNLTGGPSGTPQPPTDTNQGKSDANGHCPDGSTPSAGGCNAGYSDNGCDAPPTCSGDALLCGQIRETHKSYCDNQKFLADNGVTFKPDDLTEMVNTFSIVQWQGQAAWNNSLPEGCSQGADGAVNCTPGSASTTPADVDAPQLEEKRFWGGRAACPGIQEFTLNGQASDMSVNACKTTGYLGDIILAGAYIIAALGFAKSMSGG